MTASIFPAGPRGEGAGWGNSPRRGRAVGTRLAVEAGLILTEGREHGHNGENALKEGNPPGRGPATRQAHGLRNRVSCSKRAPLGKLGQPQTFEEGGTTSQLLTQLKKTSKINPLSQPCLEGHQAEGGAQLLRVAARAASLLEDGVVLH